MVSGRDFSEGGGGGWSNLTVQNRHESKGSLYMYKQIKPPLVVSHAFQLTEFVCKSARIIVLI